MAAFSLVMLGKLVFLVVFVCFLCVCCCCAVSLGRQRTLHGVALTAHTELLHKNLDALLSRGLRLWRVACV